MRAVPWLSSLFGKKPSSKTEKSTLEHGDWSRSVPTQVVVYSRQKELMPLPLVSSSGLQRLDIEDNTHETTPEHLHNGAGVSHLMSLPAELRRKIFTYVLGCQTIHLVQKPRRLGHFICPHGLRPDSNTKSSERRSSTCGGFRCWGMVDRLGITYGPTGHGLLSLGLTSRAAYHETIDLLYERNVFALGDPVMLGFLQQSVLPARMAAISAVSLLWTLSWPFYDIPLNSPLREAYPPVDEEKWEWFWAIVRDNMPRLKNLYVDIWSSALKITADDATERKILQSVEDMRLSRKGLVPLEVTVKFPWREIKTTCGRSNG